MEEKVQCFPPNCGEVEVVNGVAENGNTQTQHTKLYLIAVFCNCTWLLSISALEGFIYCLHMLTVNTWQHTPGHFNPEGPIT